MLDHPGVRKLSENRVDNFTATPFDLCSVVSAPANVSSRQSSKGPVIPEVNMDRAKVVFGHLNGHQPSRKLEFRPTAGLRSLRNTENDVVICSAKRTPICKAKRGGLRDVLPDDLLSTVFTGVINDVGLDPTLIGDICVGNVLQPGSGASMARLAQFFSNIPETVPLSTVNRQCSSGLQACMHIAHAIKAGTIDIGIGGGVESMSLNGMAGLPPGFVLNPKAMDIDKARDCMIPMGITSENVAERYNIGASEQNQMAFDSHKKASFAQKQGYFKSEIVPVNIAIKKDDDNEKLIRVSEDDGIRPETTMERLAKLRPAFKEDGTTTAGNSSQISDGAAAVLFARRSAANKHGLPVIGVVRGYAVVGVPPDVMGIGPAYAIPAALKNAGLSLEDIDIFEINEAFASQAVYCVKKLGIPMEKVNPKGGAIALGHPLGCTGARQIATLLHECQRRGKRCLGVVSMCIGTGMGAAAVIEYPGN